MFSRILIKLIDQAIVPALLLVVARIVTVLVVSSYFGTKFTLSGSGFVFQKVHDYILINSYSIFLMILVLTVGLLYILVKSLFFHETHISPGLTAKVFSLRLSAFIQSSFDLYSQTAIWMSYLYLLTFVSAVMAYFGLLYVWVFFSALVLSVISTYFFAVDLENELFLQAS